MPEEELPPQYDHATTEKRIYELWERSGYFNPDKLPKRDGADESASTRSGAPGEPYTIIMPPSNANAAPHAGHALGFTIQDILIRYHRMRGRRTLWLPGTDHAGFETQVVFEKKLEKEGRSRFQMTREEFYKETWDFVQQNKHLTEEGIKRLGASCDWGRNLFTLDQGVVNVVYETFQKMHQDGLVYRGNRICNWCPKHQTGLADLETKYEERTDTFYYFKYGPFTIGTARPETKFGDKYVVMHPDDKRYAEYKDGQKIELEWINGPIAATVIKDKAVDMEFGTGAMTITPWHDAVDFEIAERRGLEMEQIIDTRGKLLPIAGEFAGMKIAEARPKIVEKLKQKGLLVEEKTDPDYKHNVQLCYKCGTVIEPQIIPQWYIAMTKPLPDGRPSLRDMAIQAVKSGEVEIVTERFRKVFMHWMENVRDWPISRQIWWGIPIPVWYDQEGNVHLSRKKTVFLARHGQSEANVQKIKAGILDYPLTAKGREQAEALAERANGLGVKKVISSGLSRNMQTAEIVAEKLGVPVEIWEDLHEIDAGELNGTKISESGPKNTIELALSSKNGETAEKMLQRAQGVLEKLRDLPEENVLVVGHSSFNRVVTAAQEGIPPDGLLEYRRQKGGMHNGSMLTLTFWQDPQGDGLVQDPDTFDTWFSSGQWPFATMMANDAKRGTRDIETYFPTQVMETAWDIIFFWVARMIMLSYYRTGRKPFEKVLLHGLVRDKDRQKMSKSKGNVVDPLGVIDAYGTDALRFALVFSTAAGNDIPLAEDKIKGMKHFANKVWNIARFVLANAGAADTDASEAPAAKTDADKAILDQLKETAKGVTASLESLELHAAAQAIYDFIWRKFADVYLEASKAQLKDKALAENTAAILRHVLTSSLALLHPFMPFVTEEIYQKIAPGEVLMVRQWPGDGA